MMTLWSNFRNWWGSDFDPSYLYSSWLVRSACRPARFLFYASSSTVLVSIQNLDGNFYQWVSREESSPLIWTVHRDSRSFLAINRINGRSGSINWRKSGSLAWDEKIQFILISSLAEQRFLRLLKKDFLCYTIYRILMCDLRDWIEIAKSYCNNIKCSPMHSMYSKTILVKICTFISWPPAVSRFAH